MDEYLIMDIKDIKNYKINYFCSLKFTASAFVALKNYFSPSAKPDLAALESKPFPLALF